MRAYLSLGSNIGDRLANLQAAVNFLDLRAGKVLRISGVYETAPLYVLDQAPFYNAVAEVETALPPIELLKALKAIEAEIGRVPRRKHGPREIDIDILCAIDESGSSVRINEKSLTMPHPQMTERRFVLEPLRDMDPNLVPKSGLPKQKLLGQHVELLADVKLSIHRD